MVKGRGPHLLSWFFPPSLIPKFHAMTFVTSASNSEISRAQPYYFYSNAPFILQAFLGHWYDRELRNTGWAGSSLCFCGRKRAMSLPLSLFSSLFIHSYSQSYLYFLPYTSRFCATSMLGSAFSDFPSAKSTVNINSSVKHWDVGPKNTMLCL